MVYFSKWKVFIVLGIVALGLLFAAPNLVDQKTAESLPSWLPYKQVSLGLDLQGGSHLLLDVETDVVVNERLTSIVEGVRIALRRDKIRYTGLSSKGGAVSVGIREPAQLQKAQDLTRPIKLD